MTRCRRTFGFTLLEILIVIAILATLAALLFPVFANSKREGLITEDLQKLHQCQVAVALYQNDNSGAGIPPFSLPLPPDWLSRFNRGAKFYGTDTASWATACPWHLSALRPNFAYFADTNPESANAYTVHGERTILIADANCSDPNVDFDADYETKLGLGVLVDGTLVRKLHQGNVYTYSFWEGASK